MNAIAAGIHAAGCLPGEGGNMKQYTVYTIYVLIRTFKHKKILRPGYAEKNRREGSGTLKKCGEPEIVLCMSDRGRFRFDFFY